MSGCIVIGGSAGSLEPLRKLVSDLPIGLPAAVFVVIHTLPNAASVLPKIIGRAGVLPAVHAEDDMDIVPGQVYVAPPDRHLTIEAGRVRVLRGPRHNSHRPAIDPLFSSAAAAYGPANIAVLLSGMDADGSLGLLDVRSRGGIAIVQEPDDA